MDDLRHGALTTSENILIPMKRLRQQVNDTDAEDIHSLKALTVMFMNEMLDYMSAIARDNILIHSRIKPFIPLMSYGPSL